MVDKKLHKATAAYLFHDSVLVGDGGGPQGWDWKKESSRQYRTSRPDPAQEVGPRSRPGNATCFERLQVNDAQSDEDAEDAVAEDEEGGRGESLSLCSVR